MNFDEALKYIQNKSKFGINLELETTSELLDKIGNPHKKLNFIHIAGTNGKGSTTSYIADILMKKGYKTGKYISPAVHSFTERMQINNEEISHEDLAHFTSVVKDAAEKYNISPTEFELETVIGMLYFESKKCDYVVLEVGMGGRYDATNVIPPPKMAVITSISLDHTEYLGDTVEKIAFEKCGIIKEGSMVVSYADNPEEANNVIKNAASEKNAPLFIPDKKDINIISESVNGTDFCYKKEKYHINMLGSHQVLNAVSAIEVSKKLGIEYDTIKSAIENTKFRGRFEIASKNPFIIEDGAHNYSGVANLKNSLKKYFPDKKIILVMSMLNDKEYSKCIKLISPIASTFIACEINNSRKASAQAIASEAKKYVDDVMVIPNVNDAVKAAKEKYDENTIICI
ncbi:MAG: bifunctional folylpolyglutamate synthase/dihydrofolate synthase, partial [Clostridia bacterium]|nr:bifunctional folylpolyglutamate synthase/dihydrofolate synthase [Clostridia bacterium]